MTWPKWTLSVWRIYRTHWAGVGDFWRLFEEFDQRQNVKRKLPLSLSVCCSLVSLYENINFVGSIEGILFDKLLWKSGHFETFDQNVAHPLWGNCHYCPQFSALVKSNPLQLCENTAIGETLDLGTSGAQLSQRAEVYNLGVLTTGRWISFWITSV